MKQRFLTSITSLAIFVATALAPLPANAETLEQQLIRHEGYRSRAYKDRGGYSIGYGTRLTGTDASERLKNMGVDYRAVLQGDPITKKQAATLFYQDVNRARNAAKKLIPDYQSHPPAVRDAVGNMIYNLGISGFAAFGNLRESLSRKDYAGAAKAMQDSPWYHNPKTNTRARELVKQVQSATKK